MTTLAVYRIVKEKHRHQAFDGEGAKLFGGRWNSRGRACVYVAGSQSLAVLEILVHLSAGQPLGQYRMFRLELPVAETLKATRLPDDWRAEPAPASTAAFGDQWLRQGASLALALPSTIIPDEFNYLINPDHTAFDDLVASAELLDFDLDPRLVS